LKEDLWRAILRSKGGLISESTFRSIRNRPSYKGVDPSIIHAILGELESKYAAAGKP
jgi:hypothetical protein